MNINKKIKVGISINDTFLLNQYKNQPEYLNKHNEWIRHLNNNDFMFHFFMLTLIMTEKFPNLDSLSMSL